MPGMDGLKMIQQIKEYDKKANILIISAYSDTKYVLEAIDLDVQGFHVKPIDKDRLVEQLDELLRQILLEEKLREEKEKFRVLSSAARDAIIIMDSKGLVTFWNQGAERIFGYKQEEIVGRELHTLIAQKYYYDDYKRAMSSFRKNGDGKFGGKIVEPKALKKDGSKLDVELSLTSITYTMNGMQWLSSEILPSFLTEETWWKRFIMNRLDFREMPFLSLSLSVILTDLKKSMTVMDMKLVMKEFELRFPWFGLFR